MKHIITVLILILSFNVTAGGDSQEVRLLSLNKMDVGKYELKYKPVTSESVVTVRLEFNPVQYLFFKMLTKQKYEDAIALLKKQVSAKKTVRFGAFGGGPCLVDKENNIYRSDALDIYDENHSKQKMLVVYAFCKYS